MCDKAMCRICEEKPVYSLERCSRCYTYLRIHGVERPKNIGTPKLCSNCHQKPAVNRGRCRTCRSYFQRTGKERPPENIKKRAEREAAPRWCKNCGSPDICCNLRCDPCEHYLRIHGKERPYHLYTDDPRCKNCGIPLSDSSRRKVKGRCKRCREYRNIYKKERPQHLWGNGSEGWCECGKPANHSIDKFALCDECAVEYKKGAYS